MTKEASAESSLRFQLLRALLPPIGCNTRGVWAICGAAVGNNRQGAPGRPLPNLLPPKPTLTSPKTSLTSGFALCFINSTSIFFSLFPLVILSPFSYFSHSAASAHIYLKFKKTVKFVKISDSFNFNLGPVLNTDLEPTLS